MSLEEYETFKIIILGNLSVGKTSILLRYVNDKFKENILSTIGVDFMDKLVDLGHKKINLQIWDTSGQEQYKSLAANFLRDTDGVFLVFDLTNDKSFDHIKTWLNDIKDYNEEVKIIILGNKFDLSDKRKISNDVINNFVKKHNFKYFETSAKEGTNIKEAFKAMIDLFMEKKSIQTTYSKLNRGNLSISVASTVKKKKPCCASNS